jgi:16S rRNA (uracil1498-N3)-methyltransferase
MHRFYVPDLPEEGSPGPLPQEEAQHLLRVLRLAKGDEVRVFDGRGREHVARVEALTKSDAIIRIGAPAPTVAEPRVAITLAQALLKGDKFDEVVRDATMLGVARIQPLLTARCEVPRARSGDTGRVDRWHRVAVSSAKQCGRAVVPDVMPVASLAEFLSGSSTAFTVMLAEPALASASSRELAPWQRAQPGSASLLIGPEGGWADEEHALAERHQASMLTLGTRTLRAERAALVALAVLTHAWGDL